MAAELDNPDTGPREPVSRQATLAWRLLIPLMVLGLSLTVLSALGLWFERMSHFDQEIVQKALIRMRAIERAAQTLATPAQLQRLVSSSGADRDVEWIVVVAGEPPRVLAATRGSWLEQPLAALPPEVSASVGEVRAAAEPRPVVLAESRVRVANRISVAGPNSDRDDWATVALQVRDAEVAALRIRDPLLLSGMLVTLLVVLATVCGLLLRGRVLRPLAAVQDILARRAAGERQARVELGSEDEIGRLAQVLNKSFDDIDALGSARDQRERQMRETLVSLASSERRFRLSSEVAKAFVWEYDIHGHLNFLSESFGDVMGHPPETYRNAVNNFSLDQRPGGLSPDARQRKVMREALANCLRTGTPMSDIRGTLQRADGTLIETVTHGMAVRNEEGRVTGALGITVDVSAQRGVEQRLITLLAAAGGAMYVARAIHQPCTSVKDFAATYVSDGVLALTGHSPEDYTTQGDFWVEHLHPDDAARVLGGMAPLFETGQHSHEYRFRHRDGHYLWMHDELRLRRNVRGEPVEIHGFWYDVTERRNSEDIVRRSERKYRELFDNATEGILVAQDERIVLVNPAAAMMHGRSADQMIGNDPLLYAHPLDLPTFQAARVRRRAGIFERLRVAGRILRPDGATVWVENSVVPVDWDGRPAVLAMISDVTERRKAEEQLLQSQKLEAIGQMTGGLAHDFNNLLGVIVGNLDLLEDQLPDDAQMRARVRTALDAAMRGAETTRSLLAVARRQPMTVAMHDLNALVENQLPLLRSSVGSAITVGSQLAAGSLMVHLDGGGLSNVVLNLGINARDAMKDVQGERRLRVATRQVELAQENPTRLPAGFYAVLEVSDNGAGMSEEVLARAMEPFFTTKEEGHGTGLGLAMVHSYAEQLGGTVMISSRPGQGTTVTLYLPLDAELAAVAAVRDAQRLEALRGTGMLNSRPTPAVQDLVEKAAELCQTPIALVSLIDKERQVFFASTGLSSTGTPREDAFCAHAILDPARPFVVPDALVDPRFSGNPLVLGEPRVRFYAAITLRASDGQALGTLCVIDYQPRAAASVPIEQLESLAREAEALIAADSAIARAAKASTAPVAPASSLPVAAPMAPSASRRVLVVDDEDGLRDLASTWLAGMGYQVTTAGSGDEAMALLEQSRFDILFTDVVMPGSLDGLALAREAKQRWPSMQVAIASGYAQSLLGATDLPGPLLSKPYRKPDLVRLLTALDAARV